MMETNLIAPLLESLAELCCIEFQVCQNGRCVLRTTSYCAQVDDLARQAAISRFAPYAQPFEVKLQPCGTTVYGTILDKQQDTAYWLVALVPHQNMTGNVMALLQSLVKLLKTGIADKNEINELALALETSYEELALLRRIHKSFSSGVLSYSQLHDILTCLKKVVQADLVFSHFPTMADLDMRISNKQLKKRCDPQAFSFQVIECITKGTTTFEDDHITINNSKNDPLFASLCGCPFRMIASRAIYNDHDYGWIGVVSFNLSDSFKLSHFNIMQAAASQVALTGGNQHLIVGLKELTSQIANFKNECDQISNHNSIPHPPIAACSGDFLDKIFTQLSNSIDTVKIMMLRSAQMVAIGQMAAVFAHEIKQPVFALDDFIQIAESKLQDPEQVENFKLMGNAVQRTINIIKRFESFSRPIEKEFKLVSLNHIAKEVYLLVTPQLKKKHMNSNCDQAPSLPFVMGDAQSLQQVVLNLVSNAIQAMTNNNGRGARLCLKTYHFENQVCLDVIDTGQGIPKDLLDKIMTPYFTTSLSAQGAGLGLTVVRDIVEQHNGCLEIESEPGLGSRFTLKLPGYFPQSSN